MPFEEGHEEEEFSGVIIEPRGTSAEVARKVMREKRREKVRVSKTKGRIFGEVEL